MTDPDGEGPGKSREPVVRTHLSRTGQRAGAGLGLRSEDPARSGSRDAAFRTVRLIDVAQYDTDQAPIEERLTAFLLGLRRRRLLLAYFSDLREREQEAAPAPARPYDRDDLRELRGGAGLLPVRASLRRPVFASGAGRRRGRAPAKGGRPGPSPEGGKGAAEGPSGRGAGGRDALGAPGGRDRRGAACEEMPWMAPATEAAWHALRRSARLGEPVRVGPLVLVGPPGVGKTAWARRLAGHLAVASTVIDASQGLSSFSLTGTERGWRSSQPGRPLADHDRQPHRQPDCHHRR